MAKDFTQAKIIGLSDKVQDAIDIHELLVDMGIPNEIPTIYQDNQPVLTLRSEDGKPPKNKHIHVRQATIREKIKKWRCISTIYANRRHASGHFNQGTARFNLSETCG